MNALHFFFGVGAFLAPLIVGWIIAGGGRMTWAYWVLALLLMPVLLWFAFLPSPPRQSAAQQAASAVGKINIRLVAAIGAVFFLYSGAEVAFGGWIYTYAKETGLTTPARAAYITSAFWGALTLGRLLSIPLATRLQPVKLLFGCLGGCLASLMLLFLFPQSLPMLWIASCGLGLSMAAVFPTMLSFSGRRMPLTGQVTGIFFMLASLGVMCVPWLIGQTIEVFGPQSMTLILLTCLLGATAMLTGITLNTRTRIA